MTHRYNVFIREHQIVRFSIEVETDEDVRAAIFEPGNSTNRVARNGPRRRKPRSTMRKSSRSMNWTLSRGRSRNPSTSNP